MANSGINTGTSPLEPGAIVAIQGINSTKLDNAPTLWNVVPAGSSQAVIGVVRGRAELETVKEFVVAESGLARALKTVVINDV